MSADIPAPKTRRNLDHLTDTIHSATKPPPSSAPGQQSTSHSHAARSFSQRSGLTGSAGSSSPGYGPSTSHNHHPDACPIGDAEFLYETRDMYSEPPTPVFIYHPHRTTRLPVERMALLSWDDVLETDGKRLALTQGRARLTICFAHYYARCNGKDRGMPQTCLQLHVKPTVLKKLRESYTFATRQLFSRTIKATMDEDLREQLGLPLHCKVKYLTFLTTDIGEMTNGLREYDAKYRAFLEEGRKQQMMAATEGATPNHQLPPLLGDFHGWASYCTNYGTTGNCTSGSSCSHVHIRIDKMTSKDRALGEAVRALCGGSTGATPQHRPSLPRGTSPLISSVDSFRGAGGERSPSLSASHASAPPSLLASATMRDESDTSPPRSHTGSSRLQASAPSWSPPGSQSEQQAVQSHVDPAATASMPLLPMGALPPAFMGGMLRTPNMFHPSPMGPFFAPGAPTAAASLQMMAAMTANLHQTTPASVGDAQSGIMGRAENADATHGAQKHQPRPKPQPSFALPKPRSTAPGSSLTNSTDAPPAPTPTPHLTSASSPKPRSHLTDSIGSTSSASPPIRAAPGTPPLNVSHDTTFNTQRGNDLTGSTGSNRSQGQGGAESGYGLPSPGTPSASSQSITMSIELKRTSPPPAQPLPPAATNEQQASSPTDGRQQQGPSTKQKEGDWGIQFDIENLLDQQ